MKIHFPRLYRYERKDEHCSVAIPFPQGAFRKGMRLQIMDGDQECPVQSKITSFNPDGSARYLFSRFTATLPANHSKELHANVIEEEKTFPGISVKHEASSLIIDGGKGGLHLVVEDDGDHLITSLTDQYTTYHKDRFIGPILKDGQGETYRPQLAQWEMLEQGPLVAVLSCKGTFCPASPARSEENKECPTFEVKLTMYSGKPWLEVSFRLINTTSQELHASSLVFSLPADGSASPLGPVLETTGIKQLPQIESQMQGGDVRCCTGISNYKTKFQVSRGECLEKSIDTAYLMAEANEHYTEVFFGTFFADWTGKESGVCATVFQAQQNYPKAVKSSSEGLEVMLVPENVERVVFQSGMSREQRFLLHFHGPEESLCEIDNRSLIYQMPDKPWVDPDLFREAGVAPDIFVAPEKMVPDIEIELINRCDAHTRSFGMLNFGDAPDPNYTQQGRGKGMFVWTNNEYDFPHACALLYMRTGERRFLDYLLASGSHWMDVDVCHYSNNPLHFGGQWEHCRGHVLDSTIVCSHQWVEGLLDYYHFTGDERAFRTALGIGENIRRLLETPDYQVSGESNARETGWALRTLTALYLETWDKKWLEKAEWIVDQFEEWAGTYGSWVAVYTDNTIIHTPFMIAVAMGSLARYYKVFPSERIRRMLLDAADDLMETCLHATGLFIYKELPSLSRQGSSALLLEAMTIAYNLSGDVKYLKAGLPTFRHNLAHQSKAVGHKYAKEGTVLIENDPPKNFAQSFIPLSVYYKAASDEGLL